MHELSNINTIFEKIKETGKTKRAVIVVGALRGEKDVFIHFLKEMSRGTAFEDMEVTIKPVPMKVKCSCGYEAAIQDPPHLHVEIENWPCPKCGKSAKIVNGYELFIESAE